ncbi:cell wall protein IFF6-like isoform X3 [Sphaeramia orbicularis]|nr:cell wall protein IFF6-like isoform X3 [Sphaeramia orbicularis]XP_029986065.1 cell wall protein IFF6-like isoform X3 [Sphaeramia orbicularis]
MSNASRSGFQSVQSVMERVVVFLLSQVVDRPLQEEVHFYPHPPTETCKLLWREGEAVGFYSVKHKGSLCDGWSSRCYQLTVLDTLLVRRRCRRSGLGLHILDHFCNTFYSEDVLGVSAPLSASMVSVCRRFLHRHTEHRERLYEVEAPGGWAQRRNIWINIQLGRYAHGELHTLTLGPGPGPGLGPGPRPGSGLGPRPGSGQRSGSGPRPESGLGPGSGLRSGSGQRSGSGPRSGSGLGPGQRSGSGPGSGQRSGSGLGPGSGQRSGSGSGLGPGSGPRSQSGQRPGLGSGQRSGSGQRPRSDQIRPDRFGPDQVRLDQIRLFGSHCGESAGFPSVLKTDQSQTGDSNSLSFNCFCA